jgi:hypothetical protein
MEIEMTDFSFDFNMPEESVILQGSVQNIMTRFQYSKVLPTESILVSVVLRDAILEISEQDERAMLYAGHIIRFLVDFHLPTGMMDVMANLYGEEHDMEVCIPRFMAFFKKFQDADDYCAGIKISRGMEPSGKMSMCGEIDHMKVGITDPRVPGQQLIMRMEKARASLSTFKMTVDKRRTHKGRICLPEQTPSNRTIGSEAFLPPLQNADFSLSMNSEKEMTAICGKVLFQLSSLSNQFYVEEAEFFKVVAVMNERDFVDIDNTKISLQTLNMLGLDQNMIDWLMVLQDTSNRLPNSVHSHPRNVKMEFHGRSMQISMCPLSFTTDLATVRHIHNDHRRSLLPHLPLDDERLIAFFLTDINIAKSSSVRQPNVSFFNSEIALLEVRTCLPLTDFQAQHQIILLDAIDSNECSITTSRRSSFKESIEQSRSVPQRHHPRGHMDQTFSSYDCRNWKRPGTGTSWKFTSMQFSLEMGERVLFKQMNIKQMAVDMINTCRLEVGQSQSGLGHRSPAINESRTPRSWRHQSTASSSKKPSTKSGNKAPKSRKPLALETSRHEFFSIVGISIVWTSITDNRITMKAMNAQGSVAGALKFLCAYKMIKSTVDAMLMRLECVRIVGDHLIDNQAFVKLKVPPNEDAKSELRIEDCTVTISASIDDVSMLTADSTSQSGHDSVVTPTPRGGFGGITGLTDQETGRCLIVKFRNLVHGTSSMTTRYHFDQCEMSLSHHPSKPFVSIDAFDYRIKKTATVLPTKSPGNSVTMGGNTAETPEKKTQYELYMKTFVLQMHSAMDVGLLAESLLQQDTLYKAAMAPKADRKNPYIIYDSVDMTELQTMPGIAPFPLTRGIATTIPHLDLSMDDHDTSSPYGFVDIAGSDDGVGYHDYHMMDAVDQVNPMSQSRNPRSPIPFNLSTNSSMSQLNLNEMAENRLKSPDPIDPTEVERSTFTVTIESFIVKMEIPLPNSVRRRLRNPDEECIMTISLSMIQHRLEQLKDSDGVQDDILKLDIGEEALLDDSMLTQFYIYQQIQGGSIKFQAKSMQVLLSTQPEPMIDIVKPSMSGLFYMASLKDDRIPVEYQISQLLDAMRIAVKIDDNYSNEEESIENAQQVPNLLAITENAIPIYGVLRKSLAPTKIYADVDIAATSMDIKVHEGSMKVFDYIGAAVECNTPPNHDISPPMAWWDSLRYWMHGSMSMNFGRMSFAYVIPNVSVETMTIKYSLADPAWHVDRSSFEFTTRDVEAWVELISQLSQAGTFGARKTPRGRVSSDQQRTGSNTTKSTKKNAKISRIGHIPGFILALRYSSVAPVMQLGNEPGSERQSMRSPNPNKPSIKKSAVVSNVDEYNHHHVYLKPTIIKRVEEGAEEVMILGKVRYLHDGEYYDDLQYQDNDRFVSFRKKPNSVKWDLEVRFANREKQIISCNLRLDILLRVYVALFQPGGQSGQVLSPDVSTVNGSVGANTNRPFANNASQSPRSNHSNEEDATDVVVKKQMPLMAMIAQMDVQMIIDELMLSSLLSDANYKGIILKHQIMDVQLRLTRKGLEGNFEEFLGQVSEFLDKHPLQVEHLFIEMYMYEIYVDTWSRLMVGRVRPPPMSRVPFDDPSYHGESEVYEQQTLEPSEPVHFTSMMKPICKFGHASRIVISLTESGEVSNRSSTFKSTGILNPAESNVDQEVADGAVPPPASNSSTKASSGKPRAARAGSGGRRSSTGRGGSMFVIGKEWRRRSCAAATASTTVLNRIHQLRHSSHGIADSSSSSALRSAMKPGIAAGGSMRAKSDFGASPPSSKNSVTFREMPTRRISILDPSRRNSVKALSNSNHAAAAAGMGAGATAGTAAVLNVPVPKWNPQWGYRASLRGFAANHSAFTPPEQALPNSYQGPRTRNVAGTASIRLHGQPSTVGGASGHTPYNQSSFGNKIWGLRVVDGRILFTIDMRDVLFEYVARTMEIFMNGEDEEALDQNVQHMRKQAQKAPPAKEKASLSDFMLLDDVSPMQQTHYQNSLMLSPDLYHDGSRSPGGNTITRNRIYSFGSVEENGWDGNSMSRMYLRQRSSEQNELEISPFAQINAAGTSSSTLLYSPMNHQHHAQSQDDVQRQSSVESLRQTFQHQHVLKRGKSGRRGSLFNRSIEMPDHEPFVQHHSPPPSSSSDTNNTNVVNTNMTSANSHRHSSSALPSLLLPSALDPSQQMSSPSAPTTTRQRSSVSSAGYQTPTTSGATGNRAAGASTPQQPKKKSARKPINEYFFVVEFIDPQVNFLDPETHSSVIIVAGRAMVEGQRSNTAILPPQQPPYGIGGDHAEDAGGAGGNGNSTAKRRREIRLKMDGVSAYTVPSLLSENSDLDDEVHWKVMQSTADKMELKNMPREDTKRDSVAAAAAAAAAAATSPRESLASAASGHSGVRHLVATSASGPSPLHPHHSYYHVHPHGATHSANPRLVVAMRGIEQQESPFMKVAIRDFQIRALYIFWTDVTSEEAKDLYVQNRDEDMTYTFRLELPDLVVDITSWQFYIILHVVKNVFLVPPPAQASKRKQDEAEEAEGSKFVVVPRDPSVLAKYNFRSAGGALDINNQRSREELRILLEEFMSNQYHQQQFYGGGQGGGGGGGGYDGTGATARFMEVFIGRMSWILRTTGLTTTTSSSSFGAGSQQHAGSGAAASDHELIEAGFVGIYASINFHENRSLNSSFEIQRFWMVNRNPGADTSLFEDRTCVMVPVLKEREVCTRCNREFDLDHNPSTACIFHADDDGNPGQYCEIIYRDELSGQDLKQMSWTCCHKHHKEASGCSARPHMGKEVMVSIRLDADPRARFGEDVDVSVIKGVEISIFPGASYDLRLQVTKSLADVLHRYFSIDSSLENMEAMAAASSSMLATSNATNNNGNNNNTGTLTTSGGAGRSEGNNNNNSSSNNNNNNTQSSDAAALEPSSKKKTSSLLKPFNIFKRSKARKASLDTSSSGYDIDGGNRNGLLGSYSYGAGGAGQQPTSSSMSVSSSGGGDTAFPPTFSSSSSSAATTTAKGRAAGFMTTSTTTLMSSGNSKRFSKPLSLSAKLRGGGGHRLTGDETSLQHPDGSDAGAHLQPVRTNLRGSSRYSHEGEILLHSGHHHGHGGGSGSGGNAGHGGGAHQAASVTTVAKKPKKKRQEALYLRRLRVGEIYVDVSTAGFTLNLDRFKAEMEPFICRGEVLDWRRLIWNFERHLVWSLTKHTASNSLTRLGEFFAGKRKASTATTATATSAILITGGSGSGIAATNSHLLLGIAPPPPPPLTMNMTMNNGSLGSPTSTSHPTHHSTGLLTTTSTSASATASITTSTTVTTTTNNAAGAVDISGRGGGGNSGNGGKPPSSSPQLTADELSRHQQERLKTALLLGVAQPHPRSRLRAFASPSSASSSSGLPHHPFHTPGSPAATAFASASASASGVAGSHALVHPPQSSGSSVNSDLTTSDDRESNRKRGTPARKRLFGLF